MSISSQLSALLMTLPLLSFVEQKYFINILSNSSDIFSKCHVLKSLYQILPNLYVLFLLFYSTHKIVYLCGDKHCLCHGVIINFGCESIKLIDE